MTGPERADLRLVLDIVREWREEDREWKGDLDKRMRTVEGYISGQQAKDSAADKAGVNRRAKLALIVSAISVSVSTVMAVIAVATRFAQSS